MSTGRTITLTREGEWWVALDEETDIASQGRTRSEALENLDDAIADSFAALDVDTLAPEPTVPWFETDSDGDLDGG